MYLVIANLLRRPLLFTPCVALVAASEGDSPSAPGTTGSMDRKCIACGLHPVTRMGHCVVVSTLVGGNAPKIALPIIPQNGSKDLQHRCV
jgi:hypothetical protein